MGDASWKDWCKGDGVSVLQDNAAFPPRSSLHVSSKPQPLIRTHQRPVSAVPPGTKPVRTEQYPGYLKTDHTREYIPPKDMPRLPHVEPGKFDALARTAGWAPHSANLPGSQRAVYDPVSHKTTMYTFSGNGGVSRQEGKGDGLMRQKALDDAFKSGAGVWHGRRKGVVEFRDRTHFYAVNSNAAHLETCAKNPRAYANKTGEMTKWMDNAFESKMKVPFYGKHPHEMNK